MVCIALWASPFADAKILGSCILIATAGTSLAGWVEGVHLHYIAAIELGLVFQHTEKFSPAYIGYGLGQFVVSQHILDLQVFNGNQLVFPYKPGGFLMQEILADIGHPFMCPGYLNSGFVAVIAAFDLS